MKTKITFVLLLIIVFSHLAVFAKSSKFPPPVMPTEETSPEGEQDFEVYEFDTRGLNISETLIVGKHIRKAIVHLPSDYKPKKSFPLVIVLHGARLNGRVAQAVTGFDKLANQKDFIVAYPDALNRQWDDGRKEGDTPSYGVDDVLFISKFIDYMIEKYNVNPAEVYVTGYSSGGMLAQKLGMELTDKIAAIAEVAASLPLNQLDMHKKPSRPISVLMINGTADHAFPWDGGTTSIIRIKVGAVAPIMTMFDYWVSVNGGAGDLPNRDDTTLKKKNGPQVDVLNRRTENGRCIMLYTIKGGGHTWPGSEVSLRYIPFLGRQSRDLKASELIWEFFKRNENDCQAI